MTWQQDLCNAIHDYTETSDTLGRYTSQQLSADLTEGMTALHFAVMQGNHAATNHIIYILGDKASELAEKPNDLGWTPLHLAVAIDDTNIVRCLINTLGVGAEAIVFFHCDKEGKTPFSSASDEMQQIILTAIQYNHTRTRLKGYIFALQSENSIPEDAVQFCVRHKDLFREILLNEHGHDVAMLSRATDLHHSLGKIVSTHRGFHFFWSKTETQMILEKRLDQLLESNVQTALLNSRHGL